MFHALLVNISNFYFLFLQLFEEGIVNHLTVQWFPKSNAKLCELNKMDAPQTRIQTIAILLVILAIGILLSIVLVFLEVMIKQN